MIEKFIDNFMIKEKKDIYFLETKDKSEFTEGIRKFLIDHEI